MSAEAKYAGGQAADIVKVIRLALAPCRLPPSCRKGFVLRRREADGSNHGSLGTEGSRKHLPYKLTDWGLMFMRACTGMEGPHPAAPQN